MKTLARAIIASWFCLISFMQLGPLLRLVRTSSLDMKPLLVLLPIAAVVLIGLLATSIIRSRRRGSLGAAIILGIYSAGILANNVLLGPVAHKLNVKATVFLLAVIAVNCISIVGIVLLKRNEGTESGASDYGRSATASEP